MMHNGRVFKEGTPAGNRERSGGPGNLPRRQAWLSAPPARNALLKIEDLQVYYGESHAIQGVSLTLEQRRAVGGRPQRHGQDDALQHDHRPEARPLRLDPRRRPRDVDAGAARDPPSRRRLCAAGPARLAEPHASTSICGSQPATAATRPGPSSGSTRPFRGWPSGGNNGGSQLSGGEQQMLAISRALSGDPKTACHGRADRGPGARHRRARSSACW